MMRKMMLCILALLCATAALAMAEGDEAVTPWTEDTRIEEVVSWEGFGDWGRLIFPVNDWYYSGDTLGTLDLTWYNDIRPAKTVEIVNWMREKTLAGEQVFYPIYTEEEIAADPSKADTGLFFFKGNPGARFAIVNAGGGMVFVGAMHDSFPHALELSKLGYNGFALIYRPGYDTAPADLARAIAYIHEHADELEVDVTDYSLWGGSAGARMAAWLGSYRTSDFGEAEYPRPAAVIMQYTGLSDIFGNEPATYNCVGTSDGIASYPEIVHIGEDKDFTPVIEKALALGGYAEDKQFTGINGGDTVMTGFAHGTVLGVADKVIEAVKSGAIKHFLLVGGCDGARPGRNYYTELVRKAPADTVILTLACGKYRFNDLDLGTIGGLPRIMDMGQCNDAYSAIRVAVALADAFGCGVDELPLSIILSWYEQKAVCVLLTLLYLGIKNIKLGPTLPAFVSPNVLNYLVEHYNIAPTGTVDDDLKVILG